MNTNKDVKMKSRKKLSEVVDEDHGLTDVEENKLKIENKECPRIEGTVGDNLSHSNESNVTTKEVDDDDDEREKEVRKTKCERLMKLLKRSRMYAAELNNHVKAQGIINSRKKKINKENRNSQKAKNSHSDLSEEKELQSLDGEQILEEVEIDYFKKTRLTRLGFTVSSFQPTLVEGVVMRDYQLKGTLWLNNLFTSGVNGILADEMGLGKTLQVIAVICSLIESGISGPFLIIAPLSTISNWMSEFQRFAPRVPTLFFHGTKADRQSLTSKIKEPVSVLGKKVFKVVITSYEVTLFEKRSLSKIMWPYVVVDEGHRIKNHNSLLSRVLREFNIVGKLLITGTPIQNDLRELWSLLNFILPEVFNSVDTFESWFSIQELESGGDKFMEENYNINVISTLQQILIPFILRREKKDVNLKLPPKKEFLVYCPMTSLQIKLYESTIDRTIEKSFNPKRSNEELDINEPLPKRACVLRKRFESVDSQNCDSKEFEKFREKYYCPGGQGDFSLNINMRNVQMQLRKIVNHPYLIQFPLIPGTEQLKIDEDLIKNSGKLLVVDAMLSKLKTRGHKVIIFSTFKIMLDLLEYLADLRGYKYCRFDGSTELAVREEEIQQFNADPDIFVFLISIRAGGLGINLTGADTIIIYDSDWNPQVNLQSQDRCHRIGQTKPVIIYKLCTKGTIDERIIERGNAKRRLEKIIIQKGKFTKGAQNLDINNCPRLNVIDLQELKSLLSATDYDDVIHSNGFVFTDEELDELLDRSKMGEEMMNEKYGNKENNNEKIFKLLSYGEDE